MYRDKTLAVIIPAYNEEKLIGKVLKTIPAFIDHIIVVDDASHDWTGEVVKAYQKEEPKIIYILHKKNEGAGETIITGYKSARDKEIDISIVMAGHAQMDPEGLPKLLDPLVEGKVDYFKGNRLFTGRAWRVTPKTRHLWNAILSFLTKIASSYWHVADSQSGYGTVTLNVLKTINNVGPPIWVAWVVPPEDKIEGNEEKREELKRRLGRFIRGSSWQKF
jgi:glycosyltransferase involved in cell wall biosynthesis